MILPAIGRPRSPMSPGSKVTRTSSRDDPPPRTPGPAHPPRGAGPPPTPSVADEPRRPTYKVKPARDLAQHRPRHPGRLHAGPRDPRPQPRHHRRPDLPEPRDGAHPPRGRRDRPAGPLTGRLQGWPRACGRNSTQRVRTSRPVAISQGAGASPEKTCEARCGPASSVQSNVTSVASCAGDAVDQVDLAAGVRPCRRRCGTGRGPVEVAAPVELGRAPAEALRPEIGRLVARAAGSSSP